MDVVLEYITYLILLAALAALVFATSAAVLIAEKAAKAVVAFTRHLAIRARSLASKAFGAAVPPPPSHSPKDSR